MRGGKCCLTAPLARRAGSLQRPNEVGQARIRLCGATQDNNDIANALHYLCSRAVADLLSHGGSRFARTHCQLDFDQLVVIQGPVQLCKNSVTDSVPGDSDYRFQLVSDSAQLPDVLFRFLAHSHSKVQCPPVRRVAYSTQGVRGTKPELKWYTMAKKRSSSKAWLKEHRDDPYVQQAQREGYRSRACYKLLELQGKDRLLRPGMTVLDLGSAPGGWSQVAVELVGHHGSVIASDILPMDSLAGVEFIQGDFTEDDIFKRIMAAIGAKPVDLVMSDMAPNMSGMNAVDQPRSMYLVELALDMARQVLAPGGSFVAKVFQGEGFQELFRASQDLFEKVVTRKPDASRARSREVYLVASDFKGG